MVDTGQYRTKVWLTTYFITTNVKKDDTSTATTLFAFDWPNYPLSRVFFDKSIDAIYSVGQSRAAELADSDHYVAGYIEHVPVTLCAIDKTGITAIKILGQMEAELRRIQNAYPLGSVRRITGETPKTQRIGGIFLFSVEYDLSYKRDTT